MKQGQANPNGPSGQKREPIAHAIDPGGAAQLGIMVVQNPTPLNAGRGYMAPEPVSCTTSNCGSQGKH